MWFTDSDKVLWTLVVCTFINILSFAFMDENFWRFLIALAAALFALIIKHFYDRRQEKDRLKNIKKVIIDISENVHLPTLIEIRNDYKKVLEQVDSLNPLIGIPTTSTLPVENLLSDYFDKKDLIKIILQLSDLEYSQFYHTEQHIKLIVKYSPGKMHSDLINLVTENNKDYILKIEQNKSSGKSITEESNSAQKRLRDRCIYNINSRVIDLDIAIDIYKRLIQELKK